MDLRRTIAIAVAHSQGGGVYAIFDELNFLVFAQWFCLFEIARRIDWSGVRATKLELAAGLSLAFYAGFFVAPESHIFTSILGVWIAVKLGRLSREAWALAIPLVLVSVQDVPNKEFLGTSLGALMVPVDVFGAHSLLRLAGNEVNPIDGDILRLTGSLHGIKVIPSCSSIVPAFEALAAYSVFASWLRAAMGKRLIICGFLLLLGVTLINWVRLALTTLSHDSYIFWHDGAGRVSIGLSYLTLAFLLAELAAKEKDQTAKASSERDAPQRKGPFAANSSD
jgi:exosortase/archaeosortase family protein